MTDAHRLVVNAGRLITMDGGREAPLSKPVAADLATIRNGAVAIRDGRVVETGPTDAMVSKYPRAAEVTDVGGRLVLPGFVDCHTHAVFAGTREQEMAARLQGATYLEILQGGGGIHETVTKTRAADPETLVTTGLRHLDQMTVHGTTGVEIKSGYGLDVVGERKLLHAIREVGRRHPLDVVSTYLGAHAVPPGVALESYVKRVEEGMPAVSSLASYFDVFCEEGAFPLDLSVRLLEAARDAGFGLKIHAGQFSDLGGAGAAAALGAVSCDHLEHVSDDQLGRMATASTVAVLLPGAPFFLNDDRYPDGRRIIDRGVPVALATDFNPGSCPCPSMQMMIALAVLRCGMTVEEALVAATLNSACAVGRGEVAGSLAPGKPADLVVLNVETPEQIPYHFGCNLAAEVVKGGVTLYREGLAKREGS